MSGVEKAFFGAEFARLPAGFTCLPLVFVRAAKLAVLSPFGLWAGRLLFADGLPEDVLLADWRSPRPAGRGFVTLFGVSKRKRGLSRRVGVDEILRSGIENSDGSSAYSG